MRTKLIAISCVIAGAMPMHVQAQADFLDINTIHEIEILLSEPNWDYLLDSMATAVTITGTGTGRLIGTVDIDGITYDSVGIRYKGNSSYDPARDKNPLNLDLNYVIGGQRHEGKSKIKLANCYTDPSMIREALMYEISNEYMEAPRGNFVRVTINGDYKGIYTHTESIDKDFLSQYFRAKSNPLIKCDPRSFVLMGNNSNLSYLPDSMAYDTLYDVKSDYGLGALQSLCYELENNMPTIENHLAVDDALWFHALSNVFVHLDGYTAFAHNYYMYLSDNNRWQTFIWDVNMSFGGLVLDGTGLWPLNSTQLQQHDPFIYEGNFTYRPFIGRLLSNARYKKQYVAHCRTIMEEWVNNNRYYTRAEFMQNLIDSDVQVEPYPFYSYAAFLDNLDNNNGFLFSLRPGLSNLMDGRKTYINALPEFNYTQPTITLPVVNPSMAQANSYLSITAQVTNTSEVWLGYRNNRYEPFTKVQMLDDGLNNDGAAGDNVYGKVLTIGQTDIQYYIYAENSNAGRFSPARAEYEFYNIDVIGDLVINELCASNITVHADDVGDYDDWIELYNNSTSAMSLNGYYLSDDPANPSKWALPNISIPAGGFQIIWADGEPAEGPLHANFKLSTSGESIVLYDGSTNVDEVSYPAQTADITYGRYANGTGPFAFMAPTWNTFNEEPLALDEPEKTKPMAIFPNPATDFVILRFDGEANSAFQIINTTGQVVYTDRIGKYDSKKIPTDNMEAGLYVVRTQTGTTGRFIVR